MAGTGTVGKRLCRNDLAETGWPKRTGRNDWVRERCGCPRCDRGPRAAGRGHGRGRPGKGNGRLSGPPVWGFLWEPACRGSGCRAQRPTHCRTLCLPHTGRHSNGKGARSQFPGQGGPFRGVSIVSVVSVVSVAFGVGASGGQVFGPACSGTVQASFRALRRKGRKGGAGRADGLVPSVPHGVLGTAPARPVGVGPGAAGARPARPIRPRLLALR